MSHGAPKRCLKLDGIKTGYRMNTWSDPSSGNHYKVKLLIGFALLAVTGTFLLAPAIPQDPSYHQFADRNAHLGIPNFWDVTSNLPFVLVGLAGIRALHRGELVISPDLRSSYLAFFTGVTLVGPGSMYYHLAPANATLVCDRLPMAIAFMTMLAFVIAEYLSVSAGRALLWPLLLTGFISVFYWHFTETQGRGDLRLYGLVQFLPLVLIPAIMLLFRPAFTGTAYLWALLGAYGIAKLAEFLDEPIFQVFPLSGHSIKHLVAASGVYCFLLGLRRRRKITVGGNLS